jgi:hypothetical protein
MELVGRPPRVLLFSTTGSSQLHDGRKGKIVPNETIDYFGTAYLLTAILVYEPGHFTTLRFDGDRCIKLNDGLAHFMNYTNDEIRNSTAVTCNAVQFMYLQVDEPVVHPDEERASQKHEHIVEREPSGFLPPLQSASSSAAGPQQKRSATQEAAAKKTGVRSQKRKRPMHEDASNPSDITVDENIGGDVPQPTQPRTREASAGKTKDEAGSGADDGNDSDSQANPRPKPSSAKLKFATGRKADRKKKNKEPPQPPKYEVRHGYRKRIEIAIMKSMRQKSRNLRFRTKVNAAISELMICD